MADRPQKLKLPRIYAIANVDEPENALPFIERLIDCKIGLIQLRAKALCDKDFLEIAKAVVHLAHARSSGQVRSLITVNDRPDICALSRADGLHVGQDDIPPSEARRIIGKDAILGFSTHNLEQLQTADWSKLDYLAFGPIFKTSTKKDHDPPTGLGLLAQAAKLTTLPLVAIGGITFESTKEVLQAGANSVAMCSALTKSVRLDDLVGSIAAIDGTTA